MAAAQVAKKLKDKRQQRTIEGIFKKVDKEGKGSITLNDYFGIFSSHGIVVDKVETSRVISLAGEDGTLSKEKFVKIVQGSDFFMKSFDKNKDGEVTETDMMTRAELAFSALDKDKKGYITAKELMKLTKKLSKQELMSLMSKLDTDGDGQLTFEEFQVLFSNAEKRKQETQKKQSTEKLKLDKDLRSQTADEKSQTSRRKESRKLESSSRAQFSKLSLKSAKPTEVVPGGSGKEATVSGRKFFQGTP